MKKRIWIPLALVALLSGGWFSLAPDLRAFLATMPTNTDLLFWTIEQRDAGFRVLDGAPFLAASSPIPAGSKPLPLPPGRPLALPEAELAAYMESERTAGLVIVQDGQVRLERYGLGFSAKGRWTSFSVGKSITSTLIGIAMKDGHIRSLDAPLIDYIPELKGSAYDGVTVAQLLSMTTGVAWNEDYEDPNSDIAKFYATKPDADLEAAVSYMRKARRAVPPGTRWHYNSGETKLVGVLLRRATKVPAASYLSEKIWKPFGMEANASWMLDTTGKEMTDCCVQAATRDFARFGLFLLNGARIDGERIVSDEWYAKAITKQADIGVPDLGYGYQWWTGTDGSYQAMGIFGQGIFIDPKRKLVIAINSSWPRADAPENNAARDRFFRRIQALLDAESG